MKSGQKYRKAQDDLDRIGLATTIVRQGNKSYALVVNFEIQIVLKKRDSINKRILKLHKEKAHESTETRTINTACGCETTAEFCTNCGAQLTKPKTEC